MSNQYYDRGSRSGLGCARCNAMLVEIQSNNVQRVVWTGPEAPVDCVEDIITGKHPTRICTYCLAKKSS